MSELKPCPFCGSAASVYEDVRLSKAPYDSSKWYIACRGCGVQTPIATMYAIVKIWNRRANDV